MLDGLPIEIAAAQVEIARLRELAERLAAERDQLPGLLDSVSARWVPATWEGPAAQRGHAELVLHQNNLASAGAELDAVLAELEARIDAETVRLGDLVAEQGRIEAAEEAARRADALAAARAVDAEAAAAQSEAARLGRCAAGPTVEVVPCPPG